MRKPSYATPAQKQTAKLGQIRHWSAPLTGAGVCFGWWVAHGAYQHHPTYTVHYFRNVFISKLHRESRVAWVRRENPSKQLRPTDRSIPSQDRICWGELGIIHPSLHLAMYVVRVMAYKTLALISWEGKGAQTHGPAKTHVRQRVCRVSATNMDSSPEEGLADWMLQG